MCVNILNQCVKSLVIENCSLKELKKYNIEDLITYPQKTL